MRPALLAAGIIAGWTLAASAQDASPVAPQPWTISCVAAQGASAFTCRMQQVLRTRNGGQRILSVGVERVDGGNPQLILALPHGVDLTKGVDVSVDGGQARTVPIATADAAGSYARSEVDGNLLASLREGRQLNVAFASAAGQRIETQVSLKGFRAAYAKL